MQGVGGIDRGRNVIVLPLMTNPVWYEGNRTVDRLTDGPPFGPRPPYWSVLQRMIVESLVSAEQMAAASAAQPPLGQMVWAQAAS